jgi:hypothetical protein
MKRCYVLLFAALSVLSCHRLRAQAPSAPGSSSTAEKTALLIGINTYQHPSGEIKVPENVPRTGRYEPALVYPNLKGPRNDVESMRRLLTSEKFGFPNDEKHIHILLDDQATRDAILQALQQYLVDDRHSGDTVVLYVSSHGSVRVDPNGHGQLYDLDGTGRHPSYLENTIVPYDWYLGADDVFSRDLRHIFNQAASRNIHVTAIFDSCHSGSLARGVQISQLVARDFEFDPRPMPADPYPGETSGTPPESHPDNPVLVLSAAQKDQSAIDVQSSVPPHGLFTNALIETLQALPPDRSADDVFGRLRIAMELSPGGTNQQPELDTSPARRKRPLFGGDPAGSGPATAGIVSADRTGIVLDIGTAADIGTGSEFTEVTEVNSVRAVLRVTGPIGLARSRATVVSPPDAIVQPKDIVQLTKWVPAERPTLNFYAGASSLSLAEIQEALVVARAAGLKLIGDPSIDTWTHHLFRDGAQWTLLSHFTKTSAGQIKTAKPVALGAKLSAGELKKLPPGSAVWFDAPLSKGSAGALLASAGDGGPPSAAVLTSDRTQATYVIGGTVTGDGVAYAWFKRADLDAGIQTPRNQGAGCSPNSPYPLRTDWVSATQPEAVLTGSAVQLARLNGWLNLESSSLSGQADFPYRLGLRSMPGGPEIADGDATYQGDYEMDLIAAGGGPAASRWVYVLGIDCQGKGSLLWPYDGQPPGKFPTDKGRLERIALPGNPFAVQDPFGTDTYLLLTTSNPLSDPQALEFTGVVTRGGNVRPAQPADPLEDLLYSTSAGTRAAARPTPTNWSVEALRTQSRPGAPPSPAAGKQ